MGQSSRKLRNFNSLAPCGANPECRSPFSMEISRFQLTRPVRGEPQGHLLRRPESNHFNSLAPCGANRSWKHAQPSKKSISTHSPRAGRTLFVPLERDPAGHFNSLAPCGANPGSPSDVVISTDFNSLAPCGANLGGLRQRTDGPNFNSLAPCGANQNCRYMPGYVRSISTHSPRAGRTKLTVNRCLGGFDFNSLAPCGANPSSRDHPLLASAFQLTRPVRGEPPIRTRSARRFGISTHSPRAGRTPRYHCYQQTHRISTHSPRAGRTLIALCLSTMSFRFQLTRPVRGEPHASASPLDVYTHFNSLAPCGANLWS